MKPAEFVASAKRLGFTPKATRWKRPRYKNNPSEWQLAFEADGERTDAEFAALAALRQKISRLSVLRHLVKIGAVDISYPDLAHNEPIVLEGEWRMVPV